MNELSETDEDSSAGYLRALAEFAGTEPNADGIATIEFGAVTVHLAQPEATPGRVVARAEIGRVDDLAAPEDFLEDLLVGAFFGQGTQLATPSVADGAAYLTIACRAEILGTAEALETFVRRFSVLVRDWRTRLSLCEKTVAAGAPADSAASDGEPPAADIPMYERILV